MKLNINCMRDLLLYLEDWLVLTEELEYKGLGLYEIHQSGALMKYTLPEIAYTISKMKEAGFLNAAIDYGSDCINIIEVTSLTYDGHQFLDTVRPQSTWDKIRSISEKTGLKSVKAIMEIADILLPDSIKTAIHS